MATKSYKKAIEEWKKGVGGFAWIAVDLDGTLAHYDHWAGETVIGEPIPSMVEKVKEALSQGLKVKVFTARMAIEEKGVARPSHGPIQKAIRAWTKRHIGVELEATATKDYNTLEIWDDRARQVIPNEGRFTNERKKRKTK